MKLLIAWVSLLVVLVHSQLASSERAANVSFPPEWHLWKTEHGKSYKNTKEELSKHLVWLDNQEYINQHNKYADVFGYTLKINRFGDLVSMYVPQTHTHTFNC